MYRNYKDTLAGLRRPETTDTSLFYACSESQWDSMAKKIDLAATKAEKKSLKSRATGRSHAGRIMETAEGVDAVRVCSECSKKNKPCKMFTADLQKTTLVTRCAVCIFGAKTGCDASLEAAPR